MNERKSPTDVARRRDRESWIDQQIREAQERGEFDNLPGKGKPLDLTPNPYAQDQELAFKILKDAGYAPEWIELDKAIRGKLEAARAKLARRWEWCQGRLHELEDESTSAAGRSNRWVEAERDRVLAGCRQAVVAFEEEVAGINKEIAELNLKVPSSRFQRSKVDAAREIRGFAREIRGFAREIRGLAGEVECLTEGEA
jgi:DnaJ family protein C protein 28